MPNTANYQRVTGMIVRVIGTSPGAMESITYDVISTDPDFSIRLLGVTPMRSSNSAGRLTVIRWRF